MPDVGDVRNAKLTVEGGTPSTLATVMVYPPRGTPFPATPTTTDAGVTWLAEVEYTLPGLWRFFWTVTENGEEIGTEWLEVSVSPSPVAAGRRYADTVDLAGYLGEAVPSGADMLLVRATEAVDWLLRYSRFAVDADGMPADAKVLAAVGKATCAVVAWWVETGDPSGAAARFQSVSINGVSLSRGQSGSDAIGDLLGWAAGKVLDEAGLLGHPVAVRW